MNASSLLPRTRRRAGHTIKASAAALVALASAVALTPNPARGQSDGDGLVFRRVHTSTVNGPWFGGLPALGRFFTSVTPGGDLAVYDLAEDRTEVITNHMARGDSADFLIYARISPDGDRIATFWAHFTGLERGKRARSENQLRVIGRDGTGERTLISEPGPFWLSPLAWTPDGRSIIAQQREGMGGMAVPGDLEIVEVSMEDGTRRVITRLDVQAIPSLSVSPDGRYAAYGIAADDTGNRDIHAVDLTDGRSWPLVAGNGEDRLMGWHPDGSGVFFYSNRELGWGIWRLPVESGRPAGDPELIRGDVWDMVPRGFSGDQFFYVIHRASPQIRTANVDVAAGRLVTPPTMIRAPSEGWSRDPAWSPDGSHLAFLDYPAGDGWDAAQARLGIRSVHTGETRFLPFPFPSGARLFWGPETGSIRVLGHRDGVRGLFHLDLQTGAVTLLREFPDRRNYTLAFSPDGRTYYFHRDRSEIWAGDMATGRETLLARVEGVDRRIGVSPDGSTLIVRTGPNVGENRIVLIPTGGGEPREIWRGERVLAGGPFFHMTPDNRYVVAGEFLPPEGIWRFSTDGSQEPLQIFDGERPGGLRMSPDGRRIAYWTWAAQEGATEVWVIEGLVGG
jgi:Tol biopolymer transport system component